MRLANVELQALEPRHLCAAGDPLASFGTNGVTYIPKSYGKVIPSQIIPLQSGGTLMTVNYQASRYDSHRNPIPTTQADFFRFTAAGALDQTFGNGTGAVDTPVFNIRTATVLPTGKLLGLGVIESGQSVLVRLNNDGSLDTSYGSDGTVTLDTVNRISTARIYTDGTTIALASGGNRNGPFETIERFRADGSLDTSYAGGGRVIMPGGNAQPSYYIAATQFGDDASTYQILNRIQHPSFTTVFRKLAADGTVDTSFGTLGEVAIVDQPYYSTLNRLHDGWIIATSISSNKYGFGPGAIRLTRFDNNGHLVASFGTGGTVDESFSEIGYITKVIEQGDGKLVTLGAYTSAGVAGSGRTVRLNADGSRDDSFGELRLPGRSITLLATSADGQRIMVVNESQLTALATSGTDAGPATLSHTGTLTLHGTPKAENLSIDETLNYYRPTSSPPLLAATRDAWARVFTAADVRRIFFDAGAGDDVIDTPLTKKPVTVAGGSGNDTITAGEKGLNNAILDGDQVTLSGGAGNDTIIAFGHDLVIEGGAGNDRITANATGPGLSVIHGGDGSDFLLTASPRGIHAFDLYGDNGNDTLTSGHASDRLFGGPGHDTLIGDRNDELLE